MDGITQTKDSLFNVTDSAGNSKFIVKIEVKAWKTHAFLLPDKESINVCSMQPDDSDIRAELDKNCIYFLLGKQNETNSIYIGQAGTRSRDKKTVLARLDEHKKSKTEKYRGAWNTIIILTTDDDHWRSTELDYIEHLFVEIAEQAKKYAVYTDRTKPTVPYDGATISDCKETIKQGIGYAQKLGCMAFNMADNDVEIKDTHIETEPPIQKQTNISFSISNYKVDADKTVKGITEVITPDWIVSDMLDLLPWNTFNKTTKFLDPACKSGEFLTAIFHRLYELEMSNGEFSQFGQYASQMCIKHILSNQLYGLATSEESALLTQINLYTMYDPSRNIKYIPNYIDILKGVYDDNLLYECIDARTYRIQKIHLPSELIHQSVKDLRKKANKEQADKLVYEEVIYKEFGENMKFDVVIGNPPYQKTTGKTGNKGVPSGTTIYDNFVHMGIGISKNIVCMITPTKWFCGNKKLDALRNVLISDYLRELHILNAKDIFPNIIMDKICYYLYSENYTGTCTVITHAKGNQSTSTSIRNLTMNKLDCFIENDIEYNIVAKVIGHKGKSIEGIITSQNPFGLISSTRGSIIKTDTENIGMHYTGYECQGDNVGYITLEDIEKGHELINKHKVLYPHGASTSDRIFTRVLYAGPNEVCTQSYIVVGPFKSDVEAQNVVKYLKTKFVRVLIKARKVDQNLDSDRLRFIPLQTWDKPSDIDWTQSISDIDKQLYKKYNLSKEEIDYIESTIKEMK